MSRRFVRYPPPPHMLTHSALIGARDPASHVPAPTIKTAPSLDPETAQMSSYVRLRGLPFQSTEQDVAQWFACTPGGPISVTRVLFTYNNAGRKSGEAVRAPRPCAACPRPALTPAFVCVSAVCGAA